MFLYSCNGKLPGGDARKFPADPEKRIEKNLREGRGFRLGDQFGKSRGGVFDFASSSSPRRERNKWSISKEPITKSSETKSSVPNSLLYDM